MGDSVACSNTLMINEIWNVRHMEAESRFWKALDRANALLFFLLLCLASAAGFFAFASLFGESRAPDRPELSLEGEGKTEKSDKGWFLGNSVLIDGTNYVRIPLQTERPDGSGRLSSGGYYRSRGDVRNYLFTNPDSISSAWLFPTNNQLVSQVVDLRNRRGSTAVGALYLVVRDDTNRDGILTRDDLIDIGYSESSGSGYTVLVEGVDSFNGAHTTQDDRVVFFYLKGKSGYVGQFSAKQPEKFVVQTLPAVQ